MLRDALADVIAVDEARERPQNNVTDVTTVTVREP
jgi:hypothetical protein